ncbi:MAG: GntR family transcriptional regulator [Roseivivax sp.]|nr:GntR family transcriptional regulator [Roseivivax sp.]
MTNPSLPVSDLPVYGRIAEHLAREIAAGRLVDGERLPPERRMSAQFGISVGTLRKALAELAGRGLLRRVQGSGNYVRADGIRDSVYAMFRLERPGGGGMPRARVLSVDLLDKPAQLPAFGQDTRGSRIRRLRFLGDTPVALEEIWLDLSKGRVIEADLSDSLYRYYQQNLGFWIARVEDWVSVGTVPDWAAADFSVLPGTVCGYVERFAWADADSPVEFSRTWFDPDRARYVQRMK